MEDVKLRWRKTSYSSNGGECTEVASTSDGMVAVRDSKAPDAGQLTFGRQTWERFTTELKSN